MVISSRDKFAMVSPNARGEVTIDELIYSYMTDVDIVLTEGYMMGHLPKIEVHRHENNPELLCLDSDGNIEDHRLIGVVSDRSLNVSVPVFPLDHAGPVSDFLEEQFLGGA